MDQNAPRKITITLPVYSVRPTNEPCITIAVDGTLTRGPLLKMPILNDQCIPDAMQQIEEALHAGRLAYFEAARDKRDQLFSDLGKVSVVLEGRT